MWEEGYAALPGLLRDIQPKRILVLVNATWTNMPAIENDVWIETAGKRRDAGRMTDEMGRHVKGVPVTSIRHPSSWGFSIQRWREFYLRFLEHLP